MKPYEMWLVWWAFLMMGAAVAAGACREKETAAFFILAAFLSFGLANLLVLFK